MSNYPGQIDILPTVVPNAPIALVPGSVLNAYSAAISNIENAVGIDPAGPYTNVSARFSVLENVIGNIKINLSIPSSSYTYDHTDLSGSLNIDGTINNVSRPTVIGIQGYPVSSAAPDLYNVLTWNGIAWEPLPVITLQSRPVSAAAPTAGYVLTWTGSVWAPAPSSGGGGGGNFVAGGDLSGIATFQTVVGIQNHSVSSTAPTTGQVLEYNGSNWIPTNLPSSLPPSGPAGGDLSGTYPNPTVSAIRNNSITAQTLGVGQSNYALVWSGTAWSAQNVFLNQSAGGDLGDFYPNPTTRALWHAAIPEVLPSNPGATTGFVIGNVLQVTNVTPNTQALGYGPLNLATNVTGVLSTSNQAVQSAAGDVSGSLSATTVRALLNIGLGSSSLGLAQDGYVLTYSHEFNEWLALSSTTGSSLAGDISGAITNTHVAELQGTTLSIGSPSTGQVLAWNGSAWTPQSLGLTLTGDVSGATSISGTASTRVIAIQDNPINNTILGSTQDGYVLTWNNTDGMWEAIINAGGEGAFVAGGDLSGVSTDQTVIKINHTSVPASPSANTVLVASSSTSAVWQQINDLQVASGANIAGSKINTTTGGIVSIVASNTIQAAALTATTEIFLNSGSGPTIKAGSGLPSGTPATGSIWLRTDGTTDGTESIYSYEGSVWVPVGSAAAGAAGGDLSGFYPNPTVIAIQKNAIDNTVLGSTQDGYVLTWKNSLNEWKAEPNNSVSFTAGGDLSGSSTNQTVIAIQSNPVSATAATAGQFLIENASASGSSWKSLSGDATASVSTVGDITVVALQGNPVEAQSLTSIDDGYVLTWVNASTQWQALPTGSGSVTLNGDVTGSATSNTVIKINGTSVSATPSANQVLVATSGTASTWELLTNSQISTSANIAVSKLGPGTAAQILLNSSTPTPTWTNVSGDISLSSTGVTSVTKIQGNTVTSGSLVKGDFLIATTTSNWAGTALTGDVNASTVTPGLTTVVALQTNPVESQSLTSANDGYVLTWHNAGPYWYAAPAASGSFTAGGDLSGSSSSQTVESIQGVVISGTPADGYVLLATSPTAASWQSAPSGSFSAGGDLSGSSTDQTVIAIQGNPVESGTLGAGQDGYVLTWVNADTQWRAEPVTGGGGGESGKVIYTSKTITTDYVIDFSEYDYYIWCNQTLPINVTLPTPSPGRTINIKDISNSASSNNISILQNASEDIEGSASTFILSTNLGSVTLAADNNGNWWLV